MYCDLARRWGLEHELLLFLPAGPGAAAGPGRTVRLIFYREPGPDFSERDRALLELLRPHLHQAYLDEERRRSAMPQLTPRQWELLRQVAAGHTNAQIARRLGVSGGNRAHPPAEHLRQAAGVQPHGRGHPRVPRPRSRVAADTPLPGVVAVGNLRRSSEQGVSPEADG